LNYLERRNGVILRYFSEFGYLPGVLRKSSRSLSHLLMSFCVTYFHTNTKNCLLQKYKNNWKKIKVEMKKKHKYRCVNEPCPTTAGTICVLLSSG